MPAVRATCEFAGPHEPLGGNTDIDCSVAKVMVSFPDELLRRLDHEARQRGTTRSGLLQQLVERELSAGSDDRRRRIARILEAAGRHGGRSAARVRAQRRAR